MYGKSNKFGRGYTQCYDNRSLKCFECCEPKKKSQLVAKGYNYVCQECLDKKERGENQR